MTELIKIDKCTKRYGEEVAICPLAKKKLKKEQRLWIY